MNLNYRKLCLFLGIFFLYLQIPVFAGFEEEDLKIPPKEVLIITSYYRGYSWTDSLLGGLHDAFSASAIAVSSDIVELASNRLWRNGEWRENYAKIEKLLAEKRYNLIIATDNDAVDLLLEHAPELPEQQPVFFCGYVAPQGFTPPHNLNITGHLQTIDLQKNLALGRQLFPMAKTALIITDGSSCGKLMAAEVEKLKQSTSDFSILSLSGVEQNSEAMYNTVMMLPEDSFVIFVAWKQAYGDDHDDVQKYTKKMFKNAIVPVLGTNETGLSQGKLGGIMTDAYRHGLNSGQTAVMLLSGNTPRNIPISEGRNYTIFDWEVMQQFNLFPGQMPPDISYINMPRSFWDKYSKVVLPLWSAIGILSIVLVIGGILFWRQRRSYMQMKFLLDMLPNRIFVLNKNGKYFFRHTESNCSLPPVLQSINDLPYPAEKIKARLTELKPGEPQQISYTIQGQSRIGTLQHIPSNIFGADKLLWYSQDISSWNTLLKHKDTQEAQYSAAFSLTGFALLLANENGHISGLNRAAEELLQCSAASVIGKSPNELFKFLAANGSGEVASPLATVLQQDCKVAELPDNVELLLLKGGNRIRVKAWAQSLAAHNSALMVFKDITAAAKQQHEFNLHRNLLDYICHALNIFVFRCNLQGMSDYHYGNKNLWPDYADGKSWPMDNVVHPAQRSLFLNAWQLILNGGTKEFDISYNCIVNPALPGKHEMQVKEYFNPQTGKAEFLGLIRDITPESEHKEELNNANSLFQTIIDQLPCQLYLKDYHNGNKFIMANKYFHEILKQPYGSIIGKTNMDIFEPEWAEKYTADDHKAMHQHNYLDIYEDIPAADGVHHVHARKIKLQCANGKELLLGMSFNVDEMRKNQEPLLKVMLDEIPAIMTIKDMNDNGRYLCWNKYAEKLTGLTSQQVIGHNDSELDLPPEFYSQIMQENAQTLRDGEMRFTKSVKSCNGNDVELQMHLTHLTPTGKDSWIFVLGVDVTAERKLAADQLELLQKMQYINMREQWLNCCLTAVLQEADPEHAQQELLTLIGEHLNCTSVQKFEYDAQKEELALCSWWASVNTPADSILPKTLAVQDKSVKHWFNRNALQRIYCYKPNSTLAADTPKWVEDLIGDNPQEIVLLMMLLYRGKLRGCLRLSLSPQVALSDYDIDSLRSAADIFELIFIGRDHRIISENNEYEKRVVLDNLNIPILLFDSGKQLLRANKAALNLVNCTDVNQLSNGNFYTLLTHNAALENPVQHAVDKHEPYECTVQYNNHDYKLNSLPILRDGHLEYVLESLVDVTEFNRIQNQLQQAAAEAQNAAKAKSFFLATMSHEIRTPLNAVIGFSELLENSDMPEDERNECISSINVAGNALLNLINDILDLSKIESDQLTISYAPADLSKLLFEMQTIFTGQLTARHLYFKLEIPDNLPLMALDIARLRQILLNLLGNAVKFTAQGGITLKVNLSLTAPQTGVLQIHVQDTGIGITPEASQKLFQPFVQADNVRDSHAYKGTGLGLAISRRLAERMNGTILLSSEINRGSCFTLVLNNVKLYLNNQSLTGKLAPSSVEKSDTILHKKVLLVDDVPMNLKVLSSMLKKFSADIKQAGSGAEALAIIADWRPDIVFSDLWMPNMTGLELSGKIRSLSGGDQILLVAVTADSDAGINLADSPFDAVVLKPLAMDKIKEVLQLKHKV